ncbi:hypothetical protein LNN31_13460 [Acetobacterium wieringae]|uniref:Phage abortive infection protein n=1 Tax=Acetobacterium wieringae TaxID=52694 RepID=A0ABY6HDY9_9FIRM|nr:hypothetical protein [Acetobacterium wieringae]UYO61783.1 hypothetical protein LNN31_13460 [Acetobacterium wieringae]
METKEEFIKDVKGFISKNRYGLKIIGVFGVILCFGVPLIVNFAYVFGQSNALFITAWDAADMLSYYGTLLGASATIVAVTWTINFTSESAKKDRWLSENNNYKNYGLKICSDLLDICSSQKLFEIISESKKDAQEKNGGSYETNLQNSLRMNIALLRNSMDESFLKFKYFFSKLHDDEIDELEECVIFFKKYVVQIRNSIIYSKGASENKYSPKDHHEKNAEFQKRINLIILTYDFVLDVNALENENTSQEKSTPVQGSVDILKK